MSLDKDTRIEKDSMGLIDVPAEAYWGAQTERSRQFFKIGEEKMPLTVIEALLHIKRAAAKTNYKLGVIDQDIYGLIKEAADFFLSDLSYEHFPLAVWQTGSGTQSNMNVNEVIANKGNELVGAPLGEKRPVHPNDHVNASQSSNDTFPTAMHVAAVLEIDRALLPALQVLGFELSQKAHQFKDIIKIGRTHLQDATPITLGQEFGAFASQFEDVVVRVEQAREELLALPQGGTAVGTGLNAPKGFAESFCNELARELQTPFISMQNKFKGLACHDSLLHFSGVLNTLAGALMKLANDIRWLASGPRCGLGELLIPENEPGSSIMPGKVNPTQAEALTMIATQVMGNHVTVTMAASQGNFQLNVYKPVIIYNIVQSIRLLSDGIHSFCAHCLHGVEPNLDQIAYYRQQSLMLVTALNPHIGYDKAAEVAKYAHHHGVSLKEAALHLGVLTEEQFEELVRPEKMLGPDYE